MAQQLLEKWKTLPKGWTEESFKKFWDTISEKSKHPVTVCIEKMKDTMDDPGAFCASAQDRAKGNTSWRGQKKAFLEWRRQAKVDPEKQCKLLMRNFRTMLNAALKKGGNGGMEELGAIGDGLNWIKSIKSEDKAEEYLARATESFKGIRSSGAFLKAVRELVTAARKIPPKRYPSMGQTAINNALYDLSDAFVSMVMAKNRAQRALSEPDHYDSNLKSSYHNAQQRLNGFVSRHLLQSAVESPKPKSKTPVKSEPKSAPAPAPKPSSKPETAPSPEPEMDSFGLSGRYKDRAEQGNPKANNPGKKKKSHYWGA